jgi:hypothetical protein
MSSPSVSLIIDNVERITGYKVSVSPNSDLQTPATMISARQGNPVHMVLLNPKYEKAANYLVAIQCLMLLQKWATDGNVYDFAVNDDKIKYQANKAAQNIKVQLPDSRKAQISVSIVSGLLQQLNSFPCEMLVAELCYNSYQDLRTEQEYIINDELSNNQEALGSNIKAMMPKDIFEKNASMNAAFALWWSRLTGNKHVELPYKATGFYAKGQSLLSLYDKAKESDKNIYQYLVDLWADELCLKTCYEWITRKG